MKNVDFNFKISGGRNENGEPFTQTANMGLANLLETSHQTEEVKILQYYNWALKLKTGGILELNESDILELKKFILEHPHAFVFFKQPILNVLEEARKGKDKK